MDEVVTAFVEEATEHLDVASRGLLALERDAGDRAHVDAVFRAVHTVKGSAGFLALPRTERVAHATETVLARVRAGELVVDAGLVTLLLAAVDALGAVLDGVRASGGEPPGDDSGLLDALAGAEHGAPAGATDQPDGPESSVQLPSPRPVDVSAEVGAGRPSTVRVGVDTVDRLVDLVGELVTCRNELRRLADQSGDADLVRQARTLAAVAAGLRDAVLATRLLRVSELWAPLPRLVRDTAARSDRQVALSTDGGEVEIDRDVLEAVRDPLAHMVRNAVDHGIEPPAERVAAGKPSTGRLRLRAERVGGTVRIELSDDGRGIDPQRVAARAIELGLLSADAAADLAPGEVVRLVLLPGFSTARQVTEVSGRGVGMDAVRTAVERVGGTVDIRSAVGTGTTVRLTVPLSLGISGVVVVAVGGRRLALPQSAVVELVRVPAAELDAQVAGGVDRPVLRWRGTLVPLVDVIAALRGVAPRLPLSRDLSVVVVRSGDHVAGAVVDELVEAEEVVVRPVGAHLGRATAYGGTALLPDGSVALVLEPDHLVQASGGGARLDTSTGEAAATAAAAYRHLVVDAGARGRLAIPLELVDRIVTADPHDVAAVGSWSVLRRGDGLLPLVAVEPSAADTTGLSSRSQLPVVVVRTDDDQRVGLVVAGVEDVAEAELTGALEESGLAGMAVLRGAVAGQLDVRAAVAEALDTLDADLLPEAVGA